MDSLFADMHRSSAEISPCGVYRYTLNRCWDDGNLVAWLMFNPSTADASEDDHTIRKCMAFSERWGYGRMTVVNLYAIRSRDPKAVNRMPESQAIGPMNDYWIQEACKGAKEVICAWGCSEHSPLIQRRVRDVMALLEERCFSIPINCLSYRKDGHPRHPLMLAYSTPREQFFLPGVRNA